MEAEAINLISTVTDIERDEENFEICERFVLSNLLYHKFLDPDELKVKSSLKGLIQKFKIHAQPEKAGHLDSLLSKYSDGEVRKTRFAGHICITDTLYQLNYVLDEIIS